MNKKLIRFYLLLLFAIFPSVLSYSLSLQNSEIKGNKLYHEGKYEDAVKEYTQGLTKKANYTLYYNRGASFFKLGQYNKALSDFENSATYSNSNEGHIKAIYNAGNSSFMKAETEKAKNPSAALESYKKAVKHFERVIQLDQNNTNAAYNLELGRVRIEELNKQQQDQQKNDQNNNKDQQKSSSDNQNQQQQNQQKSNPDNQNQQNQDQQQQNQQNQNQHNNNQQNKEGNPQKMSASENVSPEDILKEEARRKEAVNLLLSNGSAVPVDKDW